MPETALICRLFTARPGTPTHETGSIGLTATATSFDFHRLERLPPSVFAEVTELMHTARRAGRDIIDLGMGNPDLPTPRHIVAKIREVAENPKTHRYSSSRGIPHLRRAICEWYARKHAVTLDAEQQAITLIGAREGLAHFVLMMIGPGDIVLCLDPGYTIHQYSVTIAGGELHTLLLVSPCDFLASLERTAAGGQCRRLTGIGFGKAGGEARDAGVRCAVSGAALKRRITAYGAHAIVRITPTHVPCQRKRTLSQVASMMPI